MFRNVPARTMDTRGPDASRMLKSITDPKIVNGHVVERSHDDQQIIESFASSFLERREREMIASILGMKPNELLFNAVEAEIIATRHDPTFLTGVSASGKQGFPISQFYDFVLTIDNTMSYLRGLDIEVSNLRSLATPELITQLQQQIMQEDNVPWAIAETTKYQQLQGNNDVKQAVRLGDDRMVVQQAAPPAAAAAVAPPALPALVPIVVPNVTGTGELVIAKPNRSSYDKCCDEAHIYESGVYRAIVALQQGLFLVKHTIAELLRPGDMQVPVANKQYIHVGNWINTWADNAHGNRPPFPYMGMPKDQETMAIYDVVFPGNTWRNNLLITPAPALYADKGIYASMQQLNFWYPQYYLMPKVPGLKNYPFNWQGRVYKLLGGTDTAAMDRFAFPFENAIFTNGHKIQHGGGPIAMWNFLCYPRPQGQLGVWLLKAPAGQAGSPLDANSYILRNMDIDKVTSRLHAIETDWDQVVAGMAKMTMHPAWVCPRLSRAYSASGVAGVLNQMYHVLQRNFTTQLKQIDNISLGQPDARRILSNTQRSLSFLSPGNCPEGSMPAYFDARGRPIMESDATYVDNGVRWLHPHVDVSKCTCQPRVRAPGYMLSVDGGRERSIAVPMPMTVTKAEIARQAGNGTFTNSSTSMGGLMGLSAMLISKQRLQSETVDMNDHEEGFSETDDDDDKHSVAAPKASRVSRKNNPNYKVTIRTNKRGLQQRYYVLRH